MSGFVRLKTKYKLKELRIKRFYRVKMVFAWENYQTENLFFNWDLVKKKNSYMILAPAIMTAEKDQKKAAQKCFEEIGLDPDSYRIGHTKARIITIIIFVLFLHFIIPPDFYLYVHFPLLLSIYKNSISPSWYQTNTIQLHKVIHSFVFFLALRKLQHETIQCICIQSMNTKNTRCNNKIVLKKCLFLPELYVITPDNSTFRSMKK